MTQGFRFSLLLAAGAILSAAGPVCAQEASPLPTGAVEAPGAPAFTDADPGAIAFPVQDEPFTESANDPQRDMEEAKSAGIVFARIKTPSVLELRASAKDARDLSCDSRMGVLLDNPAAREVLARHIPEVVADKRISMARGMTLKQLAGFRQTGITREQLDEINQDLASATRR